MEIRKKFRPFTNDDEYTFNLDNKTLALVLCQVQWPALTKLQGQGEMQAVVSRFGEAASSHGYEIYTKLNNVSYVLSSSGIQTNESGIIHQWSTLDNVWHINLSEQTMSLYATSYSGYDVFKEHLSVVLKDLREIVHVPFVTRIGMRYVNRLSDKEDLRDISKLFKPEVQGYSALGLPGLLASVNQAMYNVDGVSFQVKSGILQAGQSPDPAIEALQGKSWVMDLDASEQTKQVMDIQAILTETSKLADIDFDYFKSVATPAFIAKYSK